jgi:hypothetical protein
MDQILTLLSEILAVITARMKARQIIPTHPARERVVASEVTPRSLLNQANLQGT